MQKDGGKIRVILNFLHNLSRQVIICCPRVNLNDDRKQNLSADSGRGRGRPVSLRQDSCEEDRHVRWDETSCEQSR